jgi:hypothetical protein
MRFRGGRAVGGRGRVIFLCRDVTRRMHVAKTVVLGMGQAKDYAKSRERRQSISRYQEQQWEPEVAQVDAAQFPPAPRRASRAPRPSMVAGVAEHAPAPIAEGVEEEGADAHQS